MGGQILSDLFLLVFRFLCVFIGLFNGKINS